MIGANGFGRASPAMGPRDKPEDEGVGMIVAPVLELTETL
jgi:hypothetical protein